MKDVKKPAKGKLGKIEETEVEKREVWLGLSKRGNSLYEMKLKR